MIDYDKMPPPGSRGCLYLMQQPETADPGDRPIMAKGNLLRIYKGKALLDARPADDSRLLAGCLSEHALFEHWP